MFLKFRVPTALDLIKKNMLSDLAKKNKKIQKVRVLYQMYARCTQPSPSPEKYFVHIRTSWGVYVHSE